MNRMPGITGRLGAPRPAGGVSQEAASTGNTNGGLKLNRLRLERAKREVEFYEHLTSGGRKFDETGTRIAQAMQALAREILANETIGAS